MERRKKKRMNFLLYYPITALICIAGVVLFVLLYKLEDNTGQEAEAPKADLEVAEIELTPVPSTELKKGARLFPFYNGMFWGFKNENGDQAILPTYTEVLEFGTNDYTFAATGNGANKLYGILSITGAWLVNPTYTDCRPFSEGLAAVEMDDKWGFVNSAGQVIIQFLYREAGDFHEGRAKVRSGSSFGYIDTDGDLAISEQFSEAGDFSSDMAFVKQASKYYIINKVGKKITTMDSMVGETYSEGYAVVKTNDGVYSFYNTRRNRAFSKRFEGARKFSEGYAAVKTGGKWGFINSDGSIFIEPQFALAHEFNNGMAPVKDESGKWGYVNTAGITSIPCEYDSAGAFYLGFASVTKGNAVGFVNKQGDFSELYSN